MLRPYLISRPCCGEWSRWQDRRLILAEPRREIAQAHSIICVLSLETEFTTLHLLHSAVLCRIFAKRECQDDKGSRPRIKGSGRLDRTNDHRLVDALGALHVSERSKRALIAAFLDKIGPPLRPCDRASVNFSAKLQEGRNPVAYWLRSTSQVASAAMSF
jgi:hypothetical protein